MHPPVSCSRLAASHLHVWSGPVHPPEWIAKQNRQEPYCQFVATRSAPKAYEKAIGHQLPIAQKGTSGYIGPAIIFGHHRGDPQPTEALFPIIPHYRRLTPTLLPDISSCLLEPPTIASHRGGSKKWLATISIPNSNPKMS